MAGLDHPGVQRDKEDGALPRGPRLWRLRENREQDFRQPT
jgi:hypothetical protein